MRSKNKMKQNLKIGFFIAPIFCAFISIMALFMGDVTRPVFYANLPLCFMFAAFPAIALYKKVLSLESDIEELKKKINS